MLVDRTAGRRPRGDRAARESRRRVPRRCILAAHVHPL